MSSKRHGINKQQITKEDAAKDNFFGLDVQQPLAHWGFHLLAGVICVVFAMWLWMLNSTPQIHDDQLNVVTMVLSEQYPENFSRDPIWSDHAADFYPPLWRKIISILIGKFGVIGGHRVAQIPLSIAYLLTMYGVLYYLTRSVPAALLVALASIFWRWSLAETYWGLDCLQAVQPRSLALIFIPLLFVLFWKSRNSWWLLLVFFAAGLLFSVNPASLFYFSLLALSSLFLVSLNDHRSIIRLFCAAAALVVGAIPYICINIAAGSGSAAELSEQMVQQHVSAMEYRFSNSSMYFPLSGSVLSKAFLFGFSVPIFLATMAWCFRSNRRSRFDRWLVCFFLLAFVGTMAAQYVMQRVYAHFRIAPFLPNCMRGQKFAYLILYLYIAWFLAELFKSLTLSNRCVLIIVTAVIVIITPLFSRYTNNLQAYWQYNATQLHSLLNGEKIEVAGWHKAIAQVAGWARQNTPKDALFIFVHRSMSPFRIYALRSILSSQGSGGVARFNGPLRLIKWAEYQQELELVAFNKSVPRLLGLADKSSADYIIVPNDFPGLTKWELVFKDRFWTVYKKP